MGVCGGGCDVRIIGISTRGIVDAVPAAGEFGGGAGGGILKAFRVGQDAEHGALRTGGAFQRHAEAVAALGHHRIGVERVGGQAGESIESVGDVVYGILAEDDCEHGVAVALPSQCDGLVGSRCDMGIGREIAPLIGQKHIVERAVAGRRCAGAADGYTVARAGVARQADNVELGSAGEGDGVERHKGGYVEAVHNTNDKERPRGRCGSGLGIESERQVADVVDREVDGGQYDVLVVGIRGGGCMIPVEALAAIDEIST